MGQNAAMWTYASCGTQHEENASSFEIVIGKGRHWISDLHPDLPQLAVYHGKMLASKNEECFVFFFFLKYKVYYSLKISGRDI